MTMKNDNYGKLHLVFDVENLSCLTNGHVLSFAAVLFHSQDTWMEHISFKIRQERGVPRGHIDPDTVKFWVEQAMQNPEAAMDTFGILNADEDMVTPGEAREEFGRWMLEETEAYTPSRPEVNDPFSSLGIQVWGHAPRVDIIQLENTLYGGEGKAPWDFRTENDTRTLMNRWGRLNPGTESLWKICDRLAETRTPLAAHTAVRDAYRQAFMVIVDHGWLERFNGHSTF